MTGKKSAKETKPSTVVADDPADRKGRLKSIGGSQSGHWNNRLANQTVQALWLKNSSPEERDKQLSATVAALIGTAPKDELEGMMAAQLIAAHNAAMECHRRTMLGEQTFESRRRESRASQQAVAHLCAARSARPPSRKRPAKGHGRACPRPCGRAGGGRHGCRARSTEADCLSGHQRAVAPFHLWVHGPSDVQSCHLPAGNPGLCCRAWPRTEHEDRQYGRLVSEWIATIGIGSSLQKGVLTGF